MDMYLKVSTTQARPFGMRKPAIYLPFYHSNSVQPRKEYSTRMISGGIQAAFSDLNSNDMSRELVHNLHNPK